MAARDPIGIRPLFYGYDSRGVIVFASEAKNLLGLAAGDSPLPPRTLLSGRQIYLLPGYDRRGTGRNR
ncbi:MAG: hypothetical protein V8R75_09760 [Oscillospiraceae bacterium]